MYDAAFLSHKLVLFWGPEEKGNQCETIRPDSKMIGDHRLVLSFPSFIEMLVHLPGQANIESYSSNLLYIFESGGIFSSFQQIKKRRLSQWEFV